MPKGHSKVIKRVSLEFHEGEEMLLEQLQRRAKADMRSLKKEVRVLLFEVLKESEDAITNPESPSREPEGPRFYTIPMPQPEPEPGSDDVL